MCFLSRSLLLSFCTFINNMESFVLFLLKLGYAQLPLKERLQSLIPIQMYNILKT